MLEKVSTMQKYFNVAGPCNPEQHYIVPPLERNPEVLPLIEQGQYFVVHAARQTGKTTLLQELVERIDKDGKYYALYCSLETVQSISRIEIGIPEILSALEKTVENSSLPCENFTERAKGKTVGVMINVALTDLSRCLDKPLVLLFDEIDGLENGTLISFLRQLRDGYVNRRRVPFPHSIALVGMRDIRDYKA